MTVRVYGSGANVVVNYTAGANKTAGDVEELADCIGVWLDTTASGGLGPLLLMGEVVLAKEAGVAFTLGDKLYWDTTNNNLDKTKTNTPCGIATADAASADTTARVLLIPGTEEEP